MDKNNKPIKGKSNKRYRHSMNFYRKVKFLNENKFIASSSSLAVETDNIEVPIAFITSNESQQVTLQSVEDEILLWRPEEDLLDKQQHQTIIKTLNLLDELRLWALSQKLTISAVTALLQLLRKNCMYELPKDGRTLIKTPKEVVITPMGIGNFWYNGIESNLSIAFADISVVPHTAIQLVINIDGILPFNSVPTEFWPISFMIAEMPYVSPMFAAIYYGRGKPDLMAFFDAFVKELKFIMDNGITVRGQKITVKVKCFVCDTPARTFIKGTPSFNSTKSSCIKCTVDGEWDRKGRHMSYPRFDCTRRTDSDFRNKIDEDRHIKYTPLTELDIDMVDDFVVADSLHLLDLGIMRKCLHGWCTGSYNYRTKMRASEIEELNNYLQLCNNRRPVEIQRNIRGVDSLKFWKGTEYRVFLLYLGFVVLKGILPAEVYEHFILLSCAVTILSSKYYMRKINIAKALIDEYLERCIDIYGIDSISSNFHNLCHVIDDVKRFGCLSEISSYPFENKLGLLKSLVRHGNEPLTQIAKRITELSTLSARASNYSRKNVYLMNEKKNEKHELLLCSGVFNQICFRDEYKLSNDDKNSWFLTKSNEIVSMKNATHIDSNIYIYGSSIDNKNDFFLNPFKSSHLNIYASNGERNSPKLYALEEIKCKLFSLRFKDEFVFVPLLHTL